MRILLLILGIWTLSVQATAQQEAIRQHCEQLTLWSTVAGVPIRSTKAVVDIYQANSFAPVWSNENKRKALIAFAKSMDGHGLRPSDYHIDDLVKLQSATNPAAFDLLATDAWFLMANHLSNGKLIAASTDPRWHIVKNRDDYVEALLKAVASDRPVEALKGYQMSSPRYKALQNQLQQLRSGQQQSGPIIKSFAEDPSPTNFHRAVQALKKKGVLNESAQPTAKEKTFTDAVMAFQKQVGIQPDGQMGKATAWHLSLNDSIKVQAVMANLERCRWIPDEVPARRIEVNIPEYQLRMFQLNEVKYSQDVIVGKAMRQTPVFYADMRYLVLNPTWTVPPGILKNDVIPGARKDPNYLTKKNIQVITPGGETLAPGTIDWSQKQVYQYTYRQPAGPDNALGAVKFMFPNPHSIYIHDTPSKDLFNLKDRAFSSGCIRLKDPLHFAELLLKDKGISRAQIDAKVASGTTESIHLTQPIPVQIHYFTTVLDTDNQVRFLYDLYDRDGKISTNLRL